MNVQRYNSDGNIEDFGEYVTFKDYEILETKYENLKKVIKEAGDYIVKLQKQLNDFESLYLHNKDKN